MPPGAPTAAGPTALVLGAGGMRGPALAGFLRRLRSERIQVDIILGSSVGAIVAAVYAGLGMEPETMIDEARRLGPSALVHFALSRWRLPFLSARALGRSGPIPEVLRRLDRASFETLHHGVRRLGLLTFDLLAREELLHYGGPGLPAPLPLGAAVRAAGAIPALFPPLGASMGGRRRLLVDAGWMTAVPVERAFAPPVRAARVLAVDLSLRLCLRQARPAYWEHLKTACGERLVVLRPRVRRTGTVWLRRGDLDRLVAAGEECLDDAALAVLRAWPAGGVTPMEPARGAHFP